MKPFTKAGPVPVSEHEKAVNDVIDTCNARKQSLQEFLKLPKEISLFEARIILLRHLVERQKGVTIWFNDVYQVSVYDKDPAPQGWPRLIHLSIKRIDREPIHDWRDLQEIKNLIIGAEHEAVELYPAESRRVDSANQYHLFVLEDAKARFPFGFQERYVTDSIPGTVAKQRPL